MGNRSVCFASATAFIALFATVGVPIGAQVTGQPPPYPAPGRVVDIGGWRLHLNCTGERRAGQPAVILEAGAGDFSVEWSLVQPGVSRFARVCSYDRAGDGWSDLGPHPRTFRQIVYELHTLMERAGEQPPYVLVGHSYGGWLVRTFQTTHPGEVAGLADASVHANEPPRDRLPMDAQRVRTWALGQLGHVAAAVNPFEHEELAALRAGRARLGGAQVTSRIRARTWSGSPRKCCGRLSIVRPDNNLNRHPNARSAS